MLNTPDTLIKVFVVVVVGSVKARLGTWPNDWPICWWLAGGQLSKAGGRGECLVLTPPTS